MGIRTWQSTERKVCQKLGLKHIGGPGKPDCAKGVKVAEVKDQERPVSRAQLVQIANKSWARNKRLVVTSESGFTKPAVRTAFKKRITIKRTKTR